MGKHQVSCPNAFFCPIKVSNEFLVRTALRPPPPPPPPQTPETHFLGGGAGGGPWGSPTPPLCGVEYHKYLGVFPILRQKPFLSPMELVRQRSGTSTHAAPTQRPPSPPTTHIAELRPTNEFATQNSGTPVLKLPIRKPPPQKKTQTASYLNQYSRKIPQRLSRGRLELTTSSNVMWCAKIRSRIWDTHTNHLPFNAKMCETPLVFDIASQSIEMWCGGIQGHVKGCLYLLATQVNL